MVTSILVTLNSWWSEKNMSWSLSSIVNGLTKWTFKLMMLLKDNLVEEISWWRCQWYFSFKCGNNYDIFYASGSFGCEYGTTMIYYVLYWYTDTHQVRILKPWPGRDDCGHGRRRVEFISSINWDPWKFLIHASVFQSHHIRCNAVHMLSLLESTESLPDF